MLDWMFTDDDLSAFGEREKKIRGGGGGWHNKEIECNLGIGRVGGGV